MEQQRSATREIARSVQEAAIGTQEVSGNIAGVGQAAGTSGQTANDVPGVARALSSEAGRLREAVNGFLGRVRAARYRPGNHILSFLIYVMTRNPTADAYRFVASLT